MSDEQWNGPGDRRQEERYEFARKPRKCPACGSTRVASILYGMPAYTADLQRKLDEGRVALGGCCHGPDDPAWECADCHVYMHRRLQSDVERGV